MRKFSTDIPLALTAKRLVTINNRVEHTKIESSSVRNKPVVLIKARMTDSSLFSMFKWMSSLHLDAIFHCVSAMFRGKKITSSLENDNVESFYLAAQLSFLKRFSHQVSKTYNFKRIVSQILQTFPFFSCPFDQLYFIMLACFSRVHTGNSCAVHVVLILADVRAEVIFVWKSAAPPPSPPNSFSESCKYMKFKVHTWIRLLLQSFRLSKLTFSLLPIEIDIHIFEHRRKSVATHREKYYFAGEVHRWVPANHRFTQCLIA